jgi:hypothetical protein
VDGVDGGHICCGGAHCMVHAWCELGTHDPLICEPLVAYVCMLL